MMLLITGIGHLSFEMSAQQSSCGQSEAPHEGAPPEISVGIRRRDVRSCEFPASLCGTDMSWNVLHNLQFEFLISRLLCVWLTCVGNYIPSVFMMFSLPT